MLGRVPAGGRQARGLGDHFRRLDVRLRTCHSGTGRALAVAICDRRVDRESPRLHRRPLVCRHSARRNVLLRRADRQNQLAGAGCGAVRLRQQVAGLCGRFVSTLADPRRRPRRPPRRHGSRECPRQGRQRRHRSHLPGRRSRLGSVPSRDRSTPAVGTRCASSASDRRRRPAGASREKGPRAETGEEGARRSEGKAGVRSTRRQTQSRAQREGRAQGESRAEKSAKPA